MTTFRTRGPVIVIAIVALSALSACGDDDDSASATTVPTAAAPTTGAAPATTIATSATTMAPAAGTVPAVDVCAEVTAADVAGILGQPITSATAGPAAETCIYGTSPDGADALISLAVYPGIYYDQRPSMGGTSTPVDGHTDAYALNKEVVMKWGDRSISVVDLTFSDAPVQATTEQLAQIGELLRT